MGHKKLLTLCVAAALVGCGAQKAKYTQADIEKAQQQGTLESFYTQVQSDIQAGKAPKDAQAMLTEIGKRLAREKANALYQSMTQSRLENGFIPLDKFANFESIANRIQQWDGVQARQMINAVADEQSKTNAEITRIQREMEGLKAGDALNKLKLGKAMAALAGDTSSTANMYSQTQNKVLSEQYTLATEALLVEDYAKAQRHLDLIASIEPNYKDVAILQKRVKAGNFYLRFTELLEQGKANEAYESFIAIADTDTFDEVKKLVGPTIDIMSQYFNGLGKASTDSGDLRAAYRLFQQAREIVVRVDPSKQSSVTAEESGFLAQVAKRIEQAEKDGNFGIALGFVKIIEELNPNYPNLIAMNRTITNKVLDRSVKGVATSSFQAKAEQKNLGDAIASRITQQLFEQIPNDVRIVEREKLQSIQQEQQLSEQDKAKLATANYFIEGNILEAKVDSSVKEGSKTMRVVTGRKMVDNPDYQKWLDNRKKGDEPPKQIEQEIQEQVNIKIKYHRKVGVVSASYRVIDASNAKVIYTDTVSESAQFNDESSEGIEIGEFKREHKFENLPLDLEILEKLAVEISKKIGSQLVEVLKDPEVKYLTSAETFVKENNMLRATENYASAYVLTQRKGGDAQDMLQNLRSYAMKTKYVK